MLTQAALILFLLFVCAFLIEIFSKKWYNTQTVPIIYYEEKLVIVEQK